MIDPPHIDVVSTLVLATHDMDYSDSSYGCTGCMYFYFFSFMLPELCHFLVASAEITPFNSCDA